MENVEIPENEITYTLECQPDFEDYRGNCSAIDEETDQAAEEWIREELEAGNEWAWCSVKVTARWKGFKGEDYLGGCSYRSREDFMEPGGYYDDMKAEARERLCAAVESAYVRSRSAIRRATGEGA